ncbi:hypothetical protein D9619_004765 [Psilocybe cf. subviscida]|uniref:Uncharacterized protein n=1 Tax=Psilocybe cf. subviscida TaxID=2480587 RepID=A0A8H5BPP4_9AGAR|nr:hypothetical protein D9619_004765 [Psilocybe cf. subviscida]
MHVDSKQPTVNRKPERRRVHIRGHPLCILVSSILPPTCLARLDSNILCTLPLPFTMHATHDTHDDERTPLLEQQPAKKIQTPLDKLQVTIVLLLLVCEPISRHSIYPYINELVSKLDIIGGDETKIGYYAGLI